jgi:hypothetical protein
VKYCESKGQVALGGSFSVIDIGRFTIPRHIVALGSPIQTLSPSQDALSLLSSLA